MVLRKLLCFSLLSALFMGPAVALAQQTLPNTLVLSLSPQNPRPGELVTVEVKTTSYDLSRADIGWLKDKNLAESGLGLTKYTFKAGTRGETTEVTVIVRTENELVFERSVLVRPATVDIIWETNNVSHPFYKGKSLYSQLSVIKFIAMPELVDQDGLFIPAENIYYTWKKDNEVLGSKSGYGKNSLLIDEVVLRTPLEIEVLAESKDRNYAASGKLSVDTVNPTILAYEDSPLYGTLFNRALVGNFSLGSKEISIEVYPFYFNTANRNALAYTWRINGRAVSGFEGPYLTLRNTTESTGSSRIRLDVSNPKSLVESASENFTITFGSN